MIDFFYDVETRSELDLKKVGSVKYALHSSTEITLLTWAFSRTSPVKAWRRGQPIPPEIIDVALNPHRYHFVAHNIMFDFLIWTQVLSKLIFGLRHPQIQNLSDNMALTCHFRVGASLDAAAKILQLPISKDPIGRKIMLKQCKPNHKGEWYEMTTEEWNQFEHYGKLDTRLLRDIYYMMPALPAPERFGWEWTFKRNLRGIKLDMDLVNELNDILQHSAPLYEKEFERLTGYTATVSSPIKCKEFFQQYYPEIEDMQADTLRDLLIDPRPVPAHVRRALEIKDLAAGASLAKIATALRQNVNGRIYGNLAYHHAQSKRWAARGIQVHNFPRVDDKRPDRVDFELDVQDLVTAIRAKRHHLQDPLGFIKNLLRRMFLPDRQDYKFYCGDWSKIEPTVLFWLVGLGEIPANWYEQMAATIYNLPVTKIGKDSEERGVGKATNLGAGYGMGHKKFIEDTYKKTGIILSVELAKLSINAYRKKYSEVVDLWHQLEWAFKKAIHGQSSQLCNGKIYVLPMEKPFKGVQIRLPDGSYLYYHRAQETAPRRYLETDDKGMPVIDPATGKQKEIYEPAGIAYVTDDDGSPRLKKTYGGMLTENVVSATARNIILPAIYNLERAGFEILNTVHDELWGQGEYDRDAEFEKLMCIRPSWAKDLKIEAGMKNGIRYLK